MELSFKFVGPIVKSKPLISVLVEIPKFHTERTIVFVIDTGSTKSILTEKEAVLLGLDVSELPYCKVESVGFGGFFKNKQINCPVKLTFGQNDLKTTIHYDSGFRVLPIPTNVEPEVREKLIQQTPSVLGMDVLEKFKVYLDKRKVVLATDDEKMVS